jgi:demethylmenaquinone methyltransferase/2-methoxy-6-polyprenyl-1,4-benzoquinol methylase
MFDHFKLLAPFYDRVIPPPDPGRLEHLLNLPTQGSLLDVGGGTGRVSSQLQPLVGKLILTDISMGMLRQAKGKGDLFMSLAYAERLPFPAESFDRILVVDALHHFADQNQAIEELIRVLKPSGRMVIEEPDINRLPVKVIAILERLALMGSRFYSPRKIAALADRPGLLTRIEAGDKMNAWIVVDNE